jgi:hypothetical protein
MNTGYDAVTILNSEFSGVMTTIGKNKHHSNTMDFSWTFFAFTLLALFLGYVALGAVVS